MEPWTSLSLTHEANDLSGQPWEETALLFPLPGWELGWGKGRTQGIVLQGPPESRCSLGQGLEELALPLTT